MLIASDVPCARPRRVIPNGTAHVVLVSASSETCSAISSPSSTRRVCLPTVRFAMSSSLIRATFSLQFPSTWMFLLIGPFTASTSANLSSSSMTSSLTIATLKVLLLSDGSIV